MPGQGGLPSSRHRESTGLALFDLRRDPGERYDVQAQNPEVLKEIMKVVEQAQEDLGDDLTDRPGNNRKLPGNL